MEKKVGKVIMVKTSDAFPRLIPVTAITLHDQTQCVELKQIITMGGDGAAVNLVPITSCFEFDATLMNHVNSLTDSAVNCLSAAQQLCESGLTPAEFETDGDNSSPSPLLAH